MLNPRREKSKQLGLRSLKSVLLQGECTLAMLPRRSLHKRPEASTRRKAAVAFPLPLDGEVVATCCSHRPDRGLPAGVHSTWKAAGAPERSDACVLLDTGTARRTQRQHVHEQNI